MDPYRLPRTVVPRRYDLRLEPDLAAATFTGEVVISVEVREPVTEVFLNAAELRVSAASLESEGRRWTAAITLDETTERCRLAFDGPLPVGEARLRLEFAGTLNDKLRGFYRSRFHDAGGTARTLAATQFEATDARRAFPCWDEPAFKAIFSTTLVIEPGLQAVSNTTPAVERLEGGKRVVRFADTIPMSTYLVAFVVGELEATEPTLVGETPLRVWCVPGKRRLAAFGQEIGAASLAFFERYYGRQYPGDKLDLIAIPDFAAGAMENLGAITFRETALLVDEAAATHAERERVADVVAHENAHMWFGDLVTMEWWNGLWLNEAFATFMEMLAVDAWKPEWQRWTTFGVSRSAALTVDGLRSTRPIEYPVAAPKDADAMFDVLTYEKGASVLRMLEQYIGPEVFRAGVRAYLDRHAYRNTRTEDLWLALGDASGLPIPAIMDGWVFRPGYPLLSASAEGAELVLRQQRFSYLPADGEAAGQLWQVPVQVRVQGTGSAEVRHVLLTGEETRLPLPAGGAAVVVNEGGHGFYRVRYAPDLLDRLLGALPQLAAIERFNLVNDAWAAVLAGLMPLTDYLALTSRFRGERDKNVWSVLLGSFQALNRIARDEDRPGLEALVRDRIGPALADLGWQPRPGEDELTRQLRAELVRATGTLGNDAAVHARAAEVYAAGAASAEANVFAAIIPVLAHVGDEARYAEFVRNFRAAATPQEEQRYLLALAAFRPPELIDQTLARTLNGEVRTQDAPFLMRALLYGVDSRARAWPFLQANWEQMSREYPVTGFRRMFEGVVGLARPEWEREVLDFFRKSAIDLGGKTLEQYLEQLRIAVRLREREGAALSTYLAGGG
jgi:puromycin-sensitive aminopeptidase